MPSPTPFSLAETIAVLSRTPAILNALLRGLPASWVQCDEGQNTWCAIDIVGHLIFAERTDWLPRVHIILENGEDRPFDPFDRFAQSKQSQDKSLQHLLDDFARLRTENLTALQALNLQQNDLSRKGRHPTLGTVTLSELLATWAVHDLTHLHQISRVMAHRYRETVGPWSAYLGVLQCTGHSAQGTDACRQTEEGTRCSSRDTVDSVPVVREFFENAQGTDACRRQTEEGNRAPLRATLDPAAVARGFLKSAP